ncbi:adherens junction-associated protein 1 [Erpetoichthys calabaricus]|uniref:Adherens junctions associated protein 1 n=1 Tax=Erpetoichthys calabaricus TaxID=27687 RepID=A0A8C4X6F1_ERPCA|nr:adherens junction-associated protein 1 [Erpetoichthys calabaricus]
MWIKQLVQLSSMPASRHWTSAGCHIWIMLTIIHFTMDFSFCSPLTQGSGFKHFSKSLFKHKLPSHHQNLQTRQQWGILNQHQWDKALKDPSIKTIKQRMALKASLCRGCQAKHSSNENVNMLTSSQPRNSAKVTFLKRPRRQIGGYEQEDYEYNYEGRTTTVPGFIEWGPTGDEVTSTGPEEVQHKNRGFPKSTRSTTTTTPVVTTTTPALIKGSRSSTTKNPSVITIYPGKSTTKSSNTWSLGETARPPKIIGDTAGLAVHQIITITVSLIMVIAALITTLVLKNCCAQTANGRHNGHQRKINQQEESCQNLTDFTPARVPSNMDIFTAYNESLQCSHECVRTPVPVYTDEMLQQTPMYKTAFNGNRPSPTERQLIPVAFVSEKWFEISC